MRDPLGANPRGFMTDPSSADSAATAPVLHSKGLLAASILCYLGGILIGGVTVWFVISETQRANPMAMLALVWLPLAAPYCLAGYLLRKGRRIGGWIAVLTAGLVSGVQLLSSSGAAILSPGLLGNLAIIALVVRNWSHLRPSTQHVGA